MNRRDPIEPGAIRWGEDDVPELELSDEDILDTMRHIPRSLDIGTEDFRTIYHLAHGHVLHHALPGHDDGRGSRRRSVRASVV